MPKYRYALAGPFRTEALDTITVQATDGKFFVDLRIMARCMTGVGVGVSVAVERAWDVTVGTGVVTGLGVNLAVGVSSPPRVGVGVDLIPVFTAKVPVGLDGVLSMIADVAGSTVAVACTVNITFADWASNSRFWS